MTVFLVLVVAAIVVGGLVKLFRDAGDMQVPHIAERDSGAWREASRQFQTSDMLRPGRGGSNGR